MTETITAPKIRYELGQFSTEKEINRPPKKNTFAICPIVCATAFVATTSCQSYQPSEKKHQAVVRQLQLLSL